MAIPANYTTRLKPSTTGNWSDRPAPDPFPCHCGCGRTVTPTSSDPLTKFFSEACKEGATRKRQKLRRENMARLEEGKKALRKKLQEEAGK
jgi:hypothetical protein